MFRTLLKAWVLGLTAYALVYTREIPTVYAQAVIDTDCSTDLDQPDTTYRLSGNVTNCVIAANNIILDGLDLYTISGDITSTTTATVSFTVRNVTVGGNVYSYGDGTDAGDITVEHSDIGGYVKSYSPDHNAGDIIITDSNISDYVRSASHYGYAGSVTVTDSTVGTAVESYSYYNSGDSVTITDSEVVGDLSASYITVTDSTIGDISYGYTITITNSEVADITGYDVSVTDSTVNSIGANSGKVTMVHSTVTYNIITDSSLPFTSGKIDLIDSTVGGFVQGGLTFVDNPPDLTVTPLSLELDMGESFNPFTGVSAEDVKDGDISDDVMVVGSVGDEPGVYELVYSVTDAGTTISRNKGGIVGITQETSGPNTASTTRTVTRLAAESITEANGSQSTRVGHRSSDTTPSSTPQNQSLDATLDQLRVVLAQPITTTDPEKLKELLNLLLQLVVLLTQLTAAK